MAAESEIVIRFWGVRGSIACPGADTVRYGGNTSCVEVRVGKRVFIFDAGTGLRLLGEALLANNGAVDADLFFSHTHVDHVCGLPFFRPAFLAASRLRFWAGHLLPENTLKGVLSEMMQAPLFPVPLDILPRSRPRRSITPTAPRAIASSAAARSFRISPTPSTSPASSIETSSGSATVPM